MDLALLVIATKLFLEKDKDICAGLKAGTPAWLACKEQNR